MPRVAFSISPREDRLVGQLARHWRIPRTDVLRLAVWAYVMPLVAHLPAPVALPGPADLPPERPARAPGKARRRGQ